MIGRIVRPADFQRVLTAPQRSRSVHFAIHFLAGVPSRARAALVQAATEPPAESSAPVLQGFSPELSTGASPVAELAVDESVPKGHWLGLVVPKRHAKRAVTRNLIKRQVRAAMQQHAASLPEGLWVVRLRAPFDKTRFPSPGSDALREDARAEIAVLFDRAAHAPLAPQPWRPRSPKASKGRA
ncbi:ribonuclease P protein component [Ideonella sp.]|uniref:ribonuclease P protein component n=1 Tax=Ideonella sp. TaxID=1929293 RepID=UPI003BB5FE27